MLNKHIVRRYTFIAVLIAAFSVGIQTAQEAQARAHQAQLLEQQRLAAEAQKKRIREARLQREIVCLARNIYFESGNEPFKGKLAVAQVTVNRLQSQQFPDSICAVVHQKTRHEGTTVCQFSWVCNPNQKIRYPELYAESLRAARRVLVEGYRMPELRGAKFFHADYVNPGWNRPIKARIGRHIFY